jgi:hypothetical protein
MGSEAVIFILAIGNVFLGLELWHKKRERKSSDQSAQMLIEKLSTAVAQNAKLEDEILRLRKNPLTPPAKRVDHSTIRANSAAQVRSITESAWGNMPEIGEQDGA